MSIPVFLKPFDDTHFCVAKYHQCVKKNYFLNLHDLNTQKHYKRWRDFCPTDVSATDVCPTDVSAT
jgi:hypothetical protein